MHSDDDDCEVSPPETFILSQAKKLQRKASELEREGRDLAKRYPYAASGIVGIGESP